MLKTILIWFLYHFLKSLFMWTDVLPACISICMRVSDTLEIFLSSDIFFYFYFQCPKIFNKNLSHLFGYSYHKALYIVAKGVVFLIFLLFHSSFLYRKVLCALWVQFVASYFVETVCQLYECASRILKSLLYTIRSSANMLRVEPWKTLPYMGNSHKIPFSGWRILCKVR